MRIGAPGLIVLFAACGACASGGGVGEEDSGPVDAGLQCPEGMSVCFDNATAGDVCQDTNGARQHCGGCDQACGNGEICWAGSCQAGECFDIPGYETCNDTCVDLQSNPLHCGNCNRACEPDENCDNGVCTGSCSGERRNCGGYCVDVATNPAHCHGCFTPCPIGEECRLEPLDCG